MLRTSHGTLHCVRVPLLTRLHSLSTGCAALALRLSSKAHGKEPRSQEAEREKTRETRHYKFCTHDKAPLVCIHTHTHTYLFSSVFLSSYLPLAQPPVLISVCRFDRRDIVTGEAHLVLAGGTESMTQAPYAVRGVRFGTKLVWNGRERGVGSGERKQPNHKFMDICLFVLRHCGSAWSGTK